MPALLDFLDVLGGGISRLTRILTLSHWRQPRTLPGGGEIERAFSLSFLAGRDLYFFL